MYSLDSEFGVPWAQNSCGFDSYIGGGLWHIFRHSSESIRECIRDQIPTVADIFDKMMNQTINNLQAKDEFIELFKGSLCLSGSFESTDATVDSLSDKIKAPVLYVLWHY